MKKTLIIAGVVIIIAVAIAGALFLAKDSSDIVVVLKTEAISPVTNITLATSKEAFSIPALDGKEVQQVIFEDTRDVSALQLQYSIGGIATSSSFYAEPGYRVDVLISDVGFRTFYVFE